MNQDAITQAGDIFEMFFETAEDYCCVLEPPVESDMYPGNYRIIRANRSFKNFAALHGLPVGAAKSFFDDPWWSDLLSRVLKESAAFHACLLVAASTWAEVHAVAIRGMTTALAIRMRDITQHRSMVERLIGMRRITTVGVISWGPAFALVDVNDGFMRMSGFSHAEAIGMTWQELTPPEHHPASWEAVRQVSTYGEAVPYEKEYFRRDGSRWWGLFAPRKIGDEVIEFVLDVTERRLAEAALRASDRRKDEFLATLAHELRNPLAPIKNGMQILRLTSQVDTASSRTLNIIDRQLDHLIRLVDDLLDVARITSGKVRIDPKVIPIRDILARSLEAVQAGLDSKRHRLSVELPDEDALVLADADRLTQVFSNLLSNAVKYTPAGGEIWVASSVDPAQVLVSISDSGVGIPVGQQSSVFELFTQVRDHQAHSEGGLGIGLALVNSLVRLHGGSVTLQSEGSGRGSTFRVCLPRAQPETATAREEEIKTVAVAPTRILVADDNVDAADMLANLLRAAGHEVKTASNGREALALVREFGPAVAFLDLGMPVMNGLETAREIRLQKGLSEIKLVALTGWGQASDRRRTDEAGFDMHLVKPLTPAGLQTALAIVPGGKGPRAGK